MGGLARIVFKGRTGDKLSGIALAVQVATRGSALGSVVVKSSPISTLSINPTPIDWLIDLLLDRL